MCLPDLLALGIPGGWEWILILAVVLVLFGNRIPGVARSLGAGINEFKAGLREGGDSKSDESDKTEQIADQSGAGSSGSHEAK